MRTSSLHLFQVLISRLTELKIFSLLLRPHPVCFFNVRVLSGTPCSSTQAYCCLCLMSCILKWTSLEFGREVILENQPVLLDTSALQDPESHGIFLSRSLKSSKSASGHGVGQEGKKKMSSGVYLCSLSLLCPVSRWSSIYRHCLHENYIENGKTEVFFTTLA